MSEEKKSSSSNEWVLVKSAYENGDLMEMKTRRVPGGLKQHTFYKNGKCIGYVQTEEKSNSHHPELQGHK